MLLSRNIFSSLSPRSSSRQPDSSTVLVSRMSNAAHHNLPLPNLDTLKARFKAMLEQFLVDKKLERAFETGSKQQLSKELKLFCEKANETRWMLRFLLSDHLPENRRDIKLAFLTSIYEIYENILEQKTKKGRSVFNEFNPGLEFTELTGSSPSMLFYQTELHIDNPLIEFDLCRDQVFEPASQLALGKKGAKALKMLFKKTDFIQDSYPLRTVVMKESEVENEIYENERRRRIGWNGIAGGRFSLLNSSSIARACNAYELHKPDLFGSFDEHVDQVLGHELTHTLLALSGFLFVKEIHIPEDGDEENGCYISNRQIHEFLAFTATILIRPEVAYNILLADSTVPSYYRVSEFFQECIDDFLENNQFKVKVEDLSFSKLSKVKSIKQLLTSSGYRRLNLYLAKRFLARARKMVACINKLKNKEAQQEPGFKKAAFEN